MRVRGACEDIVGDSLVSGCPITVDGKRVGLMMLVFIGGTA